MEILYLVALNALAHLAFVGARLTTTLFALHLGASEFTVGLLMALLAVLPMLLSVSTGRLVDRTGPRRPLALSLLILILGTTLPFLHPSVEILYVSSTLLGVGFMYVHIAMNSVIGAQGMREERALNFSWLALGFSISGSLGPILAGVAIDLIGYEKAFLMLGAFPAIALAMLWSRRRPLPRPEYRTRARGSKVRDLFRIPGLRRTFVVSGILAMGWDLYSFLLPLYGVRLGLAAATIGLIMATFSVATFVVRLAMPVLVRHVRQHLVIGAALGVSGSAYLLFPMVSSVPLLMALSFVLGLGLGSAQPVIMAILYEQSPPGRQGEAVGVRTSVLNASHTFIPIVSGALSAVLGMTPVFWLVAACLLGGAWFSNRQVK
ncbi:MAG TPA: MFS transporter [Burkholderiales bacterium]|nr:MFS transporter [Burkholderiales bacterium]